MTYQATYQTSRKTYEATFNLNNDDVELLPYGAMNALRGTGLRRITRPLDIRITALSTPGR